MDVLGRTQGSYPEIFVLISLLEVCQEWGVLYVSTWRMLRVSDVMDLLGRLQESYPESFVLISFLEVCQEWGVLYVGTLRTLRVPDSKLRGQGHP